LNEKKIQGNKKQEKTRKSQDNKNKVISGFSEERFF